MRYLKVIPWLVQYPSLYPVPRPSILTRSHIYDLMSKQGKILERNTEIVNLRLFNLLDSGNHTPAAREAAGQWFLRQTMPQVTSSSAKMWRHHVQKWRTCQWSLEVATTQSEIDSSRFPSFMLQFWQTLGNGIWLAYTTGKDTEKQGRILKNREGYWETGKDTEMLQFDWPIPHLVSILPCCYISIQGRT